MFLNCHSLFHLVIYINIYIYMFVGCVVLVIDKSTTKQYCLASLSIYVYIYIYISIVRQRNKTK